MRHDNVIRNSTWAVAGNVLNIIFGFISRTCFIYILNEEYLGINGLFSNVLSVLNLAELGFSSAITYNLYVPLRDHDTKKIAAIMKFYKNIYRGIALMVLTVGLMIIPFMRFIVKETSFELGYIQKIYVIYLVKTAVSYLYSYNFTLASADQKDYYTSRINCWAIPLIDIVRLGVLYVTRDFIIYIVTEIFLRVTVNIICSWYVRSKYTLLREKAPSLSKEEKGKILKNVKDIFIGKVSTTVLTSTDNIIISAMINTVTVGLLSNYNMLIGYIQGFISTASYAAQASIGNVIVTETKEYTMKLLNKFTTIVFFGSSFACVSLYCLSSDFIALLWGEKYVMENIVIVILIFSTFLQMIKSPLWITLGVCGLFEKDKYISLTGAVLNLVISIIFAMRLGVTGVILGTIISQLVQFLLKNRLLCKSYFQLSQMIYLKLMVKLTGIFILELWITHFLCQKISLSTALFTFILKCMVCVVVPNLMNLVVFFKSEALRYLVRILEEKLLRRQKVRGIAFDDRR